MWHRRRILWACIAVGWALIALSFTLNYFFFAEHYVAIFKQAPSLAQMPAHEFMNQMVIPS